MNHRCSWVGRDPLYIQYHDEEWGVPVHDDEKMFEFLVLETFQSGLSWLTILRKRENFRKAFKNFSCDVIAGFGEEEESRLLNDAGIIRNRQKISAAINNAQRFLEIKQEFGTFCNYLWSFTGNQTLQNSWLNSSQIPTKTPLSEKISEDLRRRGFRLIGPTTIYAHLQAAGLVNDHITTCFRHQELLQGKTHALN